MNNIKLNGVKNIRDIGCIESNNVDIKENLLFRSSSLENLTKSDVKKIKEKYKIKTIIDLRTEGEMLRKPDVIISDITTIHMPIFNKSVPGITYEGRKELDTKRNIDMNKMYREIVSDKYLDRIGEIIKAIINASDDEYPILYHCTEGKDRTGILTAILLLILGVEKEKIVEDYMYTNKVNKNKAQRLYLTTKYLGGDKKQANIVKNMFLAKEDYIEEIFYVIEEKWNGIDNFIKDGLKITEEEIKKFKEKMIY